MSVYCMNGKQYINMVGVKKLYFIYTVAGDIKSVPEGMDKTSGECSLC